MKSSKLLSTSKPRDEELKDIPGYEGLYAVTRDGRVWSYPKEWYTGRGTLLSHNGRLLKQTKNKSGTYSVGLRLDGTSKNFSVAGLVGKAFIENPYNKKYVCHISGDLSNNDVSNLEWWSSKTNLSSIKKIIKTTSKKVNKYTSDNKYIKSYASVKEASKHANTPASSIYSHIKRRTSNLAGFIWRYADERF